jgi:hypothetical protein
MYEDGTIDEIDPTPSGHPYREEAELTPETEFIGCWPRKYGTKTGLAHSAANHVYSLERCSKTEMRTHQLTLDTGDEPLTVGLLVVNWANPPVYTPPPAFQRFGWGVTPFWRRVSTVGKSYTKFWDTADLHPRLRKLYEEDPQNTTVTPIIVELDALAKSIQPFVVGFTNQSPSGIVWSQGAPALGTLLRAIEFRRGDDILWSPTQFNCLWIQA